MASQLDNVMNQARAAADAAPATENLPAVANTNAVPAMSRPSMDSFAESGGMVVDEYVRPDKAGIQIGKDMKGYIDDFEAIIDLSDVTPIIQIRSEVGGNTTFIKSYDGQTTSGGQNFQAEFQRVNNIPGAKVAGPFQSVEIPMELATSFKDPKSSLEFNEGLEIGYTPSLTGAKEFQKFLKALNRASVSLTSRVKVKCKHIHRKNSNNNEWGVVGFELLETLDD